MNGEVSEIAASPSVHSLREIVARISISPSATIREALKAVDDGSIGAALVCDEITGKLKRVVTDGDLRRALLQGLGLEMTIDSVNTPAPRTVSERARVEEIASLFSEQVRVIPILNDSGQVVDLAVFDQRAHLPISQPLLGVKELMYVSECVLTGWISSSGRFVSRFEDDFARFCEIPHAIATSNGTTALHLALLALDIGPGDEVLVPTLSFIASANAVTYTGACPVFVDSDAETWNLDVSKLDAALTPRTRAVMAVHLYGHPAEMDALESFCSQHKLKLIEDAAEAHGARYRGRRVGTFGDVAAFSFYGNKIITTGEGGMVVTAHREIAERVRTLRDHGMSSARRYWHPVLGYNYRMTNLQAAVGVAQMERVEAILASKRRIAAEYSAALEGIPGIELPVERAPAESVFWLYSVTIDAGRFGMDRDSLIRELKRLDIETRPLFIPIHMQPIYDTGQRLPVAENLAKHGVSLPSDPSLSSAEIGRVASAIRDAAKR